MQSKTAGNIYKLNSPYSAVMHPDSFVNPAII